MDSRPQRLARDEDSDSLVDSEEEDRSSTSDGESEAESDEGVNESDDEMHPDIAATCKYVH